MLCSSSTQDQRERTVQSSPVKILRSTDRNKAISVCQLGKDANFVAVFELCSDRHVRATFWIFWCNKHYLYTTCSCTVKMQEWTRFRVNAASLVRSRALQIRVSQHP